MSRSLSLRVQYLYKGKKCLFCTSSKE
uniref:Uncharacterized protein n=1 Tax=Anguilla anguilla TaxID=7936 RepID=A0A0E9T8R0_ANGAN